MNNALNILLIYINNRLDTVGKELSLSDREKELLINEIKGFANLVEDLVKE